MSISDAFKNLFRGKLGAALLMFLALFLAMVGVSVILLLLGIGTPERLPSVTSSQGLQKFPSWQDVAPPTGTVVVNDGVPDTNSTTVQLRLNVSDPDRDSTDGMEMRIRADGADYSDWMPYQPSVDWTLPSGDGVKIVHVEYRDPAGNVSLPAMAHIGLDQSPPDTTILEAPPSIVTSPTVTFSFYGEDLGTLDCGEFDSLEYSFYLEGYTDEWEEWEVGGPEYAYKATFSLPAGRYTFYVRARDRANNVDPTPATYTFTVQGDSAGGD